MLEKIREKSLMREIREYLQMEDSSARNLALKKIKTQAMQMYKDGKISQKFFYNTFFTIRPNQNYWEIHKDEMRKILKK